MTGPATFDLRHADCRNALAEIPDASVDAAISDPPYEIDLMGQSWDRQGVAFDVDIWREIRRVVKPGGWVAAFGARRTAHRLVCAAEDAGLEIADGLIWLYTTGNVTNKHTKLKAAFEPIMLAQVPSPTSLKATVAEHGTGYLQIDACRLPYLDDADLQTTLAKNPGRGGEVFTSGVYGTGRPQQSVNVAGRHPSNVFIDDDVAEMLGRDQRFFLCAKASRKERDAGLSLERGIARNPHTCVKPIALMAWLCRLLCPPGGTILDHTAGSGSTGCAAVTEGRSFVGIENEAIYAQTARLRLEHWAAKAGLQLAAAEPSPPPTFDVASLF